MIHFCKMFMQNEIMEHKFDERRPDMANSKFESHVAPFLDKIKLWAESGASQNEIADKLHLATSTFKLYLAKQCDLVAVQGRAAADREGAET